MGKLPALPIIVPDTGEPVNRTIGVVVAGRDVDVGVADAEAVAELGHHVRLHDLRPGHAEVLLPVVLPRLLPDDDVVGLADLMRVLIAPRQVVRAALPVEAP